MTGTDWTATTLGDVVKRIEAGRSFGAAARPAEASEWGIIRTSAMTYGEFREAENKAVADPARVDPRFEIRPGDLLLSRANTQEYVGATVLVGSCRRRLLLSDKSLRLVPREGIDQRWLRYTLAAPESRHYLSNASTGVKAGMRNVSQDILRALPLRVPPLDEQRRIVDVLEDHLSRLDAADALLRRNLRRQQALRQSLLHVAAQGEGIPLGELTVSSGYGTSAKCVVGGPGTPVVRIPNLASGRVDLADEKRVADPTLDVSHLLLQPDDLLVVRTNGSRDLIGRAAVVQDGVVAAFASYLIRFQLDAARVRPRWVAQMLHSPALRERLESLAASSAGQYNLGLAKLKSVAIPVPPLARQDAILAELEEQMSLVAAAQREAETALSRSAALRRSLLGAAFSGRL